jgi:flagellin
MPQIATNKSQNHKEGEMIISLNNRVMATSLCRNISISHNLMMKAMEKLSSGLRINRASDDPAGLIISEQMRTRIASLNQEIENISGQINKYQTASSSVMELRHNLTELRSLAVAASNGAINDSSIQEAYQAEADRLVVTFNNIVKTSSFGTQKLLDGSEGSLANIPDMTEIDFSDPEAVGDTIKAIDSQIERVDSALIEIGATQKNNLESRMRNLKVESENLTAAESQIRDTDYVREFANFMRNELVLKSTLSLMAYSNISSRTVARLLTG